MKKYLAVIKTEWQRQMTYRINQFTFRIGNIFEILVQILIWTAIFQKTSNIGGYNYREMITYIIIGWLLSFLMANFGFEDIISNHIQKGELSNFLSKPIDYINYLIFLSIGRASFTIGVALLFNLLLLFFFRNSFIVSKDIFMWLILLAMILVGYFIKLFLSILIGFISFWTVDNAGVFYSINTLAKFLSGNYFPINILPAVFLNFSLALPFIYTFYFPAQLYLGKISIRQGLVGLGLEIVWLAILYFAIRVVWKMGLRKYESVGI
ncbi:MAG: ABC-2 family transporter protein [Candidatus Moranbacteria bacterium]|nr:ABC-2 family transporter protein [Candidatus Moranbacteria bacterium]